jgi:protease-4
MAFAKSVWRLLVAIKDGLVLALLLLFFGALYAVLSARPASPQLREGALLIDMKGAVVEERRRPICNLCCPVMPVIRKSAKET